MPAKGPLAIDIKIDADRTSEEFKQIRRNARKTAGEAAEAAGTKVVLPDAKQHAPGFVRTTLYVKRRGTDAVITTRLPGKKARVVGLLEYGGTVRTVIKPKKATALHTPDGPRGAVNKPRKYKGKHFMTNAIEKNRREINEAILEETLKAFDGFEGGIE